ncbi:MAG: alpha-L-rhamnosidase-related protein [Phycisphaerae bacterium]
MSFVINRCAMAAEAQADISTARWIWSDPADPAPKNRFTWFRKIVVLRELPADATLHLAADSNARVWINGQIVRRKVARYHEDRITTERINAGPYLRPGPNVVVVLHHNWGDIITFQRTGNRHAGLYVSSTWVKSDASWKWLKAAEYMEHDKQIQGVIGDRRIRYPLVVDGSKVITGQLHDPTYDDSSWKPAVVVENGPWLAQPSDVETPGQREYLVRPAKVLAAGRVEGSMPLSDDPLSVAAGIRTSKCHPEIELIRLAGEVISGKSVTIIGKAGETKYITFDFHQPVHGYPFIALADASADVKIDLGYCELSRSLCTGKLHVDETGWIDPEGVVGPGYADRYITRAGSQSFEFPDERTARWLSLHIRFAADGQVALSDVGLVKSQYPIAPVGSFHCGNELMHQIVKLCLIHAEVTMSDTYVDTPGREDGQWIEDDRLRAILTARWFGDNNLRRFMIRTFAQGQGKDGQFHPFAPSNYPAYPATYDWGVEWTATLYDDYMWTGQTDLVREYWDTLRRFWDNCLQHVGEDGLWRTQRVLADIRNSLRPENDRQSSGIVTPWIIERLGWSIEMSEAIGEAEQATKWRQMRDKMILAFGRYHIVPPQDDIPAHVGDRADPADPNLERGYCQAGQTIAVIAGLLDHSEAIADLNYTFQDPEGSPGRGVKRWNNPTYGYRSLRALSDVGFTRRAVNHLMERYAPYLPGHPRNRVPLALQGPYGGPLPEYWINREDLGLKDGEKNPAQPDDETGSHGWGALPLLWMHESLLGVRIISPGGNKIRIAPDDGGLPFVAGHTCTPKGIVYVYWDPQQWRMEVSIPADVEADLVLPKQYRGKRIEVGKSGGPVEPVAEERFRLSIAGRYVLIAR